MTGVAARNTRPLVAEPLSRALVRPGGLWSDVRVVAETGSTSSDLIAGGGGPHGSVLVAEVQTAGRGRRGRTWTSPPGTGLTFSVLLRPAAVNPARWPWLPLLAGTAVATTLIRICALGVQLKWPNDVLLVGGGQARKVAGILSERSGDAVVVGIGVNVSTPLEDLPPPDGTSLAREGTPWVSRQELLVNVLRELETAYLAWERCGGDPDLCRARPTYRYLSTTLDSWVRVQLPGGTEMEGRGRDVDEAGRLVLDTDQGEQAVAAGDVEHLR